MGVKIYCFFFVTLFTALIVNYVLSLGVYYWPRNYFIRLFDLFFISSVTGFERAQDMKENLKITQSLVKEQKFGQTVRRKNFSVDFTAYFFDI